MTRLFETLLIALGAFIGTISRVGISHLSETFIYRGIPLATLLLNIIGSFLLGLILPIVTVYTVTYLFLVIGFLSSLTTFSTFVMELDSLWYSNKRNAIRYTVLSLGLGLLLLAIGLSVGQAFFAPS